VFRTRDGAEVLIAIQNDREWPVLARDVLGDPALAADPLFATNVKRVERRSETDARVGSRVAQIGLDALIEKLIAADIAFGRVSEMADVARHPHLRRIEIDTPGGPVRLPAPAAINAAETRRYGPIPALGAHTEKIRTEFMPRSTARPR
jgi:formyl-CoA transferase